MATHLDLNEHEEEIMKDVLDTYGYETPTDLVREILRIHRSDKRAARLQSMAGRMFPEGVKKPQNGGSS